MLHRLKAEIESLCLKNEHLQYEHAGQLDKLQHEIAELNERSESTRRELEAELTKALQDLVTVGRPLQQIVGIITLVSFCVVLVLSWCLVCQ